MGGLANSDGCKPSQLALAWVLAQGEDIVPIPGTKRRSYLEENVAAVYMTLPAKDRKRLDEVMPRVAVSGLRYSEEMMRLVNL